MIRRAPSLASNRAPDCKLTPTFVHQNRFSVLKHEQADPQVDPENDHPSLAAGLAPPERPSLPEPQNVTSDPEAPNPGTRNLEAGNPETQNSETQNSRPLDGRAETSVSDEELPRQLEEPLEYEISNIHLSDHLDELLRFRGKVDGHDAMFLIDSGSSHDFISARFVREHKVQTQALEGIFSVTLADGRTTSESRLRTLPLKVKLADGNEKLTFTVFPMTQYDIILGRPWLTKNNPQINFRTNEVKTGSGGWWTARLTPESYRETPSVELNFISGKQARHALRQGDQGFLAWVSVAEEMSTVSDSDFHQIVDSTSDSSLDERKELLSLLREFSDIFPSDLPSKLPPKRTVNHDIDLSPGSSPPSRPPYRLSKPLMDELQAQLTSLLDKGFIEHSKSPFGAPVFFVKKSDGSFRLVCDWRELNKITIKNEACLPNIDDLFDTIQGSKYFSKLDLRSGYHQVRIREEDVPKTAFNTPLGHFQFKVMGFGLCNAPATFQSLMTQVLRPYLRKFVVVFLDDILIFSSNWREHLDHVRLVLETLRKHQLFCKPSKCLLGALETLYLGHIISGHTIAPDPEKLKAVHDWPVPESISHVRRFLGFANYFRRFLSGYANIAKPLDEITGKNARFQWNKERQVAFETLKTALLTAPVLQLADVSKPFRVYTDASDLALGAVLLQEVDGQWLPVAYASRKLTPAEKNYTITEKETLAVVFALGSWKLYLFKHFDIFTDNQAVLYLRSKSNLNKRESRWAEFLADFHFSMHHLPGKDNPADPLSRLVKDIELEMNNIEFSIDLNPDLAKEISDGYADDPELFHVIKRLKNSSRDVFHDRYVWDDEKQRLYLVESSPVRLCVPRGPVRLQLLEENHDCPFSGHPGRDRTLWNLSRHFYWPHMGRSVKDFVKSCESCQRSKSSRNKVGLLQPLPVPDQPWHHISMDFIMGLPRTPRKNDAVFTFVDRLTKYVLLIPTTSTIDAEGAAQLYVNHVFSTHGLSKSIVSDRDPRFTASFFKKVFAQLGVKLQMSTSNHPQTDGLSERVNRVVEDCLRSFVDHRQSNWDELLPLCQFAINNSYQSSTCESPFFLNSGHHPLTPSSFVDASAGRDFSYDQRPRQWLKDQQDALQTAKDAMKAAQTRQAFYADRGRHDPALNVGDQVLVHRQFLLTPEARDRPSDKLRPRWYGPFKIMEVINNNAFRLELPYYLRSHPVFNVTALKRYHKNELEGRQVEPQPPVTDADGFDRYYVEKILSHRQDRQGLKYLVKWVGYPEATWEPERYLKNELGQDLQPLITYKGHFPH